MKKKVLKKAQTGTQVNSPTFPAGSSRFMDAPAKPKPTPVPAKKETKEKSKEKSKKSTNTSSQIAYYPAPKNWDNPYKKIESIDPYKDKRKLMNYPDAMTAIQQKEIDDIRASIKKKKGGAVKLKKKK